MRPLLMLLTCFTVACQDRPVEQDFLMCRETFQPSTAEIDSRLYTTLWGFCGCIPGSLAGTYSGSRWDVACELDDTFACARVHDLAEDLPEVYVGDAGSVCTLRCEANDENCPSFMGYGSTCWVPPTPETPPFGTNAVGYCMLPCQVGDYPCPDNMECAEVATSTETRGFCVRTEP